MKKWTVQKLIDELSQVKDKTREPRFMVEDAEVPELVVDSLDIGLENEDVYKDVFYIDLRSADMEE